MSQYLGNGSYAATTYDHFYNLSLDQSGNIFLQMAHDNGDSAIYDANLNFVAEIDNGPLFLEAGSYTVHAHYSSPTYGTLNVFAPQLGDTLPDLQTGSYAATTYDHFYDLSLDQSGNIFLQIAHDYGHSAIYDADLNFVAEIDNGPLFLEAGSYTVHASYASPKYGTLNVFAPQLGDTLPDLQTGSYAATTYDHFYDLSLDQSGNIFLQVAHDYGDSAIYDANLNFVAEIDNGPLFLEAGSYTVHAHYASPTYGALTVGGFSPFEPEDQVFYAAHGDEIIEGGARSDTVVYSGNQSSYTLTLSPTETILTDRKAGGSGSDQLVDIELLDFDEGLWGPTFDLETFAGPAGLSEEAFESFIELYIAYFNRAPDAVGLNFWGTAFANGTTLEEMAGLFINQDETRATYPSSLSNAEFATAVYHNVLGRIPDQEGFEFWVDVLDTGARGRDQFILAVLDGVQPNSPDRQYLDSKIDVGAYFAVHKGLSNVDQASAVMALYDGTKAGIETAVEAIEGFYQEALDPVDGAFLIQVVGILDDPFAI